MKLENQVCSLELSKKLLTLGVNQNSLYYWQRCSMCDDDWQLSEGHASDYLQCSAFTVAELGEMLPYYTFHTIISIRFFQFNLILPTENEDKLISFRDETEANARAKMIIYLLENNLIPPGSPKVGEKSAGD